MNFKAINQLKIKEAFNDSPKFQSVKENDDLLKELFECSNRGILFVYDEPLIGHSTYIEDTNGLGLDKVFIIKNQCHVDVFLWHIDGVLYKKDSKCDCVILSEGVFDLVEFKTNAANRRNESIKDNYIKSKKQLFLTLQDITNRCSAVGINIRDVVKIEAYSVFNRTVPRDDALRKQLSASFLFESNGVKLKFENCIKLS